MINTTSISSITSSTGSTHVREHAIQVVALMVPCGGVLPSATADRDTLRQTARMLLQFLQAVRIHVRMRSPPRQIHYVKFSYTLHPGKPGAAPTWSSRVAQYTLAVPLVV